MRKGDYIYTYSEKEFWPLDPIIDEISINDIGHALSLLCRGNGHVKHFYSVAQHSIACAKEAKLRNYSRRVQLACLLHDASEAYLSDITRPVKKQLSRYIEIEEILQNKIYEKFNLHNLSPEELMQIKLVDDAMLKYEMKELMNYTEIIAENIIGEYDLCFKNMTDVENEFISLAHNLQ